MSEEIRKSDEIQEDASNGLSMHTPDPLIRVLNRSILFGVRALAILMTLVIFLGIIDVVWVLYKKLIAPPIMLLTIEDILSSFGAILVVLIAIEIYLNITLYLKNDCIHVNLVVATALMAIARKVIVFDFKDLDVGYIWGTAAVVLSLGITYWLLSRKNGVFKAPCRE